jgi:monothiol glutaredoxin
VNILEDDKLRSAVKKYSDWPTYPQLFVNGELVGGADILHEMHKEGTLKELLSSVDSK